MTTEGEGEEEQKEQGGKEEEEGVGGGEGQTSIFQSPLRLVRKTKMKLVVCHVNLLDGTDFTCEVEVRLQPKDQTHTHTTYNVNVGVEDYLNLIPF